MKEVMVPIEVLDFIEGRCYVFERFKDEKDTRPHLIIKTDGVEIFKLAVEAKRS